jgi:regulator of protease activity HflC (stomatin/prohibitin superfamily)
MRYGLRDRAIKRPPNRRKTMASIRRYGFTSRAKVEASSFLAVYRNGKLKASGRGLAVWFMPAGPTSLIEAPADDRDHVVQASAATRDFQSVSVQGMATWRVAEPLLLAERLDLSLDHRSGLYRADPVAQIEALIDGLILTSVEAYVGTRSVSEVLGAGVAPLLKAVEDESGGSPRLADIGLRLAGLRLTSLTPAPELVRALRQPTVEKLQQAADEATFARRAAAVDKEAAIAENETKAKIRLEQERAELIARERDNAVAQARIEQETGEIRTGAEAEAIERLDTAKLKGERERADIARAMPEVVVIAEALKEGLANAKIGTLNLGPDVMSLIGDAFARMTKDQPSAKA